MPESASFCPSIQIMDAPLSPLVTADTLKKARALTDAKVTRYDLTTVDFKTGLPNDHIEPERFQRPAKICESALDLVGRTPTVKLTRLAQKYGLKCELGKSLLIVVSFSFVTNDWFSCKM